MAKYRAGRFIDPTGLFTVVVILVGFGMVVDLAVLVSGGLQMELLERMRSGGDWTDAETASNDTREMIVTVFAMFWQLLTAIPFLMLLSRLNHNAWSFGPKGMQFTPGWMVGWFFVPIANLVQPMLAMQEVWKVSQRGTGLWSSRPASGIVGIWWGLWIARLVISQIVRVTGQGKTIEVLQASTLFSMLGDLNNLALAVVALVLLRSLVRAQCEREANGERYDQSRRICQSCGEAVDERAVQCPLCGTKLEMETLEFA